MRGPLPGTPHGCGEVFVVSEPGWLSPALLQDAAMLHGADVWVDPFLGCVLGPVPPSLLAGAQRWARHAAEVHWPKEARLRLFGHVAIPTELPYDAALRKSVV